MVRVALLNARIRTTRQVDLERQTDARRDDCPSDRFG